MAVHLPGRGHSSLRGWFRRKRSREHYDRARTLLAPDAGRPIVAVAWTARVGVEHIEARVDGRGAPPWRGQAIRRGAIEYPRRSSPGTADS
jgi:hypothetical protein